MEKLTDRQNGFSEGALSRKRVMLSPMIGVTISSSEAVPLWLPSIRDGTPDTILGYPFFVFQQLPNSTGGATTPAIKTVVFGDFNKYVIRDVGSVEVMRLDERYAEYYQSAFVGFHRMDAGSVQYGALKHMISAAT